MYSEFGSGMRRRVPALATTILIAAMAAATLGSGASGASSHARGRRAELPGLVPGFTRTAQPLGSAASSEGVRLLADLKLRHEAQLRDLVAAVSDPASSSYGEYLTPAQFNARFAPSRKAVARVRDFARAAGFDVGAVAANRHYVELRGTVAQAESGFETTLGEFRLDGIKVHAPVETPSIPVGLSRYVSQISGLDTAERSKPLTLAAGPDALPPPATANAAPCSKFFGQKKAKKTPKAYGRTPSYVPCGYTPLQLQRAYGTKKLIKRGIDGRGQKVAIIDAYSSPTIVEDATKYSNRHRLPKPKISVTASAQASNAPELPPASDPQGWAGEETLDVDAVHAMAPGAKILYYGADSPVNVLLTMTLNQVVTDNKAQIISNSYGSAGDFDNSMDTDPILMQAAAQGIGIYFSSGDQGDETLNPDGPGDREVDATANDPLVTAVGGTSLEAGKGGRYKAETYWGTSSSALTAGAWAPALPGEYLYGGGGGVSQTYAQPKYQRGVVPKKISGYFQGAPPQADAGDANGDVHVPGRAVPDVSMVGDPNTGFISGITQDYTVGALGDLPLDLPLPIGGATQSPTDDFHYGEYRIGGTSLSSPLFAGVMALADQKARMHHGFANPALYRAYKRSPKAFRDVRRLKHRSGVVRSDFNNGIDASDGKKVSFRTFGVLNTLHLRRGYDDSTGLGSPRGAGFIKALSHKKRR
jgi:subtilase family serine protease